MKILHVVGTRPNFMKIAPRTWERPWPPNLGGKARPGLLEGRCLTKLQVAVIIPVMHHKPELPRAPAMKDRLLAEMHDHTAVVAVVGLGDVGLPLAVAFVERGFPVAGMAVAGRQVAARMRGEPYG